MILEYIQEALNRAKYEIINNDEPYYGAIADIQGIWASGNTLEECRENLKDVLEGWILLSIKKGLPIPRLGCCEILEPQEISA